MQDYWRYVLEWINAKREFSVEVQLFSRIGSSHLVHKRFYIFSLKISQNESFEEKRKKKNNVPVGPENAQITFQIGTKKIP